MPWNGPVFPVLPGETYPKKPGLTWSSVKQDALSGRRARFSLFTYPLRSYDLPFSYLRLDSAQEWQTLAGFINSVQGPVQLFGYTDPNDNTIANQEFAVGDGATLGPFQLVRSLAGFVEPVFLLNGAPAITVSGTPNTNWTVDGYGAVTFTTGNAPANGAPIAWSGSWYQPCRFDDDNTGFDLFVQKIFELKSLKFSTEKLP